MENQFVLPRRVRAKYSTFVKTLTAIVLVANVACMCLLLPGASLSIWLVWGGVIGLMFVFAGLSPVWFEEHEDRYVLRLEAKTLTFDKGVYVATPISKEDLGGCDSPVRVGRLLWVHGMVLESSDGALPLLCIGLGGATLAYPSPGRGARWRGCERLTRRC